MQLCIHAFIPSSIHQFINSSVHPFMRACTGTFILPKLARRWIKAHPFRAIISLTKSTFHATHMAEKPVSWWKGRPLPSIFGLATSKSRSFQFPWRLHRNGIQNPSLPFKQTTSTWVPAKVNKFHWENSWLNFVNSLRKRLKHLVEREFLLTLHLPFDLLAEVVFCLRKICVAVNFPTP